MDTQHTPGPWQFGIRGAGFQTAELATVFQIPTMPTEDGLGQGWAYISADKPCYEVSSEERVANGRLMAAAPDILAALHVLVELCKHASLFADCEEVALAEAAIAKAEGRS